MKSVDFEQITEWTKIQKEVLFGADNSPEVLKAQQDELDKWHEYKVYDQVDDLGQEAISTRWVLTEKVINDSTVVKAGFVARGFEETATNIRTDSLTVSKENFRLVATIAAANNWEIHSLDVKAAFLQGLPIDRTIYLVPPTEAAHSNAKLWKLNTAVYGLCDASRSWYPKVSQELLNKGATKSVYDNTLFYWRVSNKLQGIIWCEVDNFFFAGNWLFHLRQAFKLSNESSDQMLCTGIEIIQSKHQITIHQNNYVKMIEPLKFENMTKNRPLTTVEIRSFKALVGQLQWSSKQTRPDIAFAACELSTRMKEATTNDVKQANK